MNSQFILLAFQQLVQFSVLAASEKDSAEINDGKMHGDKTILSSLSQFRDKLPSVQLNCQLHIPVVLMSWKLYSRRVCN